MHTLQRGTHEIQCKLKEMYVYKKNHANIIWKHKIAKNKNLMIEVKKIVDWTTQSK